MNTYHFRDNLLAHFEEFRSILATDTGDWVVKGFIDAYRNICPEKRDLLLGPVFAQHPGVGRPSPPDSHGPWCRRAA